MRVAENWPPTVTLEPAHKLSGLTSVSPLILCQMLCNRTGEEVAGTFSIFVSQGQQLICVALQNGEKAYLWEMKGFRVCVCVCVCVSDVILKCD